jgi:deaminated glutathione amidase
MARIAVLQMTSGIDPAVNAATLVQGIAKAATGGAAMLFTPEMSGCVDRDGARARGSRCAEADDQVLAAVRDAARTHSLWVALGSLAVSADDDDARAANRSFVIAPDGSIAGRYDKIHLFDVDLPTGESWRESATYLAGDAAVIVETPIGPLGLSICYDLRFSGLYAALVDHGATAIAIPAAFTVPTGEAHWHVMQRARAIEGECFVIAAAQTGLHQDGRATYGHSLVIDPWGSVLLDMGAAPGLGFCDIDLAQVAAVRARIPVLAHRRPIAMASA